jgi:hypothetical protein
MSTVTNPGLATERTRLAWRRTTLAGAAAVVLAATRVIVDPRPLAIVAGCLMALVWLVLLRVAQRRITALSTTEVPPAIGREPAWLALLCVTLALLGGAVVR